jgi:hypothetical protein
MKKIILGVLIGLGLSVGFLVVHAGYVQDLAWQQKVADIPSTGVYRFEWYGDVCYMAVSPWSNGQPTISCLKN